jgi:hypothetical protein
VTRKIASLEQNLQESEDSHKKGLCCCRFVFLHVCTKKTPPFLVVLAWNQSKFKVEQLQNELQSVKAKLASINVKFVFDWFYNFMLTPKNRPMYLRNLMSRMMK